MKAKSMKPFYLSFNFPRFINIETTLLPNSNISSFLLSGQLLEISPVGKVMMCLSLS